MRQLDRFIILAFVYWVGTALGSIGLGFPAKKHIRTQTIQRVVRIAAPGARDSRYAYVPFIVPSNATRVSVSYEYDRANGTNTIDIGIFDSRSTNSDTDPRGFRGWSGGQRSEFFVSHNEATPGYLPGSIPAGTWRIILGLYRVRPEGVAVSFKIKIEIDGNISTRSVGGQRPARHLVPLRPETVDSRPASIKQEPGGRGWRWWRGDLHLHTVHSDGNWTIAELLSSARDAGLDFISITDHNTSSHHAEIDRTAVSSLPPLVLRGEEITTYGGHMNAWGLPSGTWIDFRSRPGDRARIRHVADRVHRSGALISINHPFGACSGCSWSYGAAISDFDAIEVWNGIWDPTDEQALATWDKLLQSGRRITAIASTDSHRVSTPVGQPTTNVGSTTPTQRALLDAVRRGRVYLTSEVGRPIVRLSAQAASAGRSRWLIGDEIHLGAPDTIRFFITTEGAPDDATISLISNGKVIRDFPAEPVGPVEIECRSDSYFRLEVRDKKKSMLALTNPIYVKIASGR